MGSETWRALGFKGPLTYALPGKRIVMADIAMDECEQHFEWTGPDSDAEKYLLPLRKPMHDLGHIGKDPVFYNWCAAFVTWCARAAGFTIPDQPPGFWATVALVDAWKYWAKDQGFWSTDKSDVVRGDIACFEWFDGDSSLDNIGVVASYTGSKLRTYEGNRGNKTMAGSRDIDNISGIIRLPG